MVDSVGLSWRIVWAPGLEVPARWGASCSRFGVVPRPLRGFPFSPVVSLGRHSGSGGRSSPLRPAAASCGSRGPGRGSGVCRVAAGSLTSVSPRWHSECSDAPGGRGPALGEGGLPPWRVSPCPPRFLPVGGLPVLGQHRLSSFCRDFSWSPGGNIIAFWVPEDKDIPARVTLMQLPTRQEIRVRNLFNVVDCKLHWQKNGDYLCVKVDRTPKGTQVSGRPEQRPCLAAPSRPSPRPAEAADAVSVRARGSLSDPPGRGSG